MMYKVLFEYVEFNSVNLHEYNSEFGLTTRMWKNFLELRIDWP